MIREDQFDNLSTILEYFRSFDFKEKLIEDVINNLKDQKELLNIGKIKLNELYPSILDEEIGHSILLEPANKFTFLNLKQLIPNESFNELIAQTKTTGEKLKKARILMANINEFIEKIDGKLMQADYLYSLL